MKKLLPLLILLLSCSQTIVQIPNTSIKDSSIKIETFRLTYLTTNTSIPLETTTTIKELFPNAKSISIVDNIVIVTTLNN